MKNVLNARGGGGELAPKVAPRRLGLLTPKLAIFYRNSVERGQSQGPLGNSKFFTPPLIFEDFTHPYSVYLLPFLSQRESGGMATLTFSGSQGKGRK